MQPDLFARFAASSLGPILLWSVRREERRLVSGQTYEPPNPCRPPQLGLSLVALLPSGAGLR